MAFCTKCGRPLDENGACVCGFALNGAPAGQPAAQAPIDPYAAPADQPAAQAPAAPYAAPAGQAAAQAPIDPNAAPAGQPAAQAPAAPYAAPAGQAAAQAPVDPYAAPAGQAAAQAPVDPYAAPAAPYAAPVDQAAAQAPIAPYAAPMGGPAGQQVPPRSAAPAFDVRKVQQQLNGLAKSPVGTSVIGIVKRIFSPNPTAALNDLDQAPAPVWAILGGAYALLCGLALMLISGGVLKGLLSPVTSAFGLGGVKMSDILPMGTLFLLGLVMGVVIFFAYAALMKLVHVIYKQPVPFAAVMTMVGVALFPTTVVMAAGVVLSLFAPMVGLFLVGVANIASVVMLYVGLQKEAKFTVSPLWAFTAAMAVFSLVLGVYVSGLLVPAVAEAMGGGLGSLF